MGSNNNKNQPQQQNTGYGPNPGQSGNDPRGRVQNQTQYQQQRYESQQGPLAQTMATNYGRGSEQDFGDRTDIMNQYRDIASGGGSSGGGGGGGGFSGSFNTYTVNPERVNAERANAQYANTERATSRSLGPLERLQAQKLGPQERVQQSNPYESYGGMQEFAKTGGYSDQDVANLRARGMAPIRAAYGNAERAIGQQRGLQGGYSPNAIAAQVKMAREQGQSMADAGQNVDAGIAQARNAGRLSGLQGMGNIEQARQNAQMQGDIFNAGQYNQGQQFDITNALNAGQFNASEANAGQKFDIGNEMNTSQFNAGQGNQVGMFNAGQGNDVSMFNAGQGNQVGQFNADLGLKGQMYNADAYTRTQAEQNAAGQANASRAAAASAQNNDDRLRALAGMSNLYGTTPGMSNMFGNQVSNIVGQGGNMGMGYIGAEQNAAGVPGQYDQTMGRVSDTMNLFGRGMDAAGGFLNNRPQQQQQRPVPNYRIPVNQNFNPANYGQQVQMSQPPPDWSNQQYDWG